MSREIEIKVDQKDLQALQDKLDTKRIFMGIHRAWGDEGNEFRNLMMNRHLRDGTTSDRLESFGGLRNALQVESRLTGNPRERVRVRIGFTQDVKDYAWIHEFGGTIKPKKGEFLTFQTKGGNWVRVREVTIPPRLHMRDEFKQSHPKWLKAAQSAVDAELARG